MTMIEALFALVALFVVLAALGITYMALALTPALRQLAIGAPISAAAPPAAADPAGRPDSQSVQEVPAWLRRDAANDDTLPPVPLPRCSACAKLRALLGLSGPKGMAAATKSGPGRLYSPHTR